LEQNLDEKEIEQIIAEYDSQGTGVITYSSFRDMMLGNNKQGIFEFK
jgi:Ca2+-binding EF-hand superfamily protein